MVLIEVGQAVHGATLGTTNEEQLCQQAGQDLLLVGITREALARFNLGRRERERERGVKHERGSV